MKKDRKLRGIKEIQKQNENDKKKKKKKTIKQKPPKNPSNLDGLACCSPLGCKESAMTEKMNWTGLRCTSADEWIKKLWYICTMDYSVQFSSVAQSCLTLCDPMNRSTPGFPVHHQLQEFTQTHVDWVGDAIQPSHPHSSPSLPAPNPSQQSGSFPMSQLFARGGQSIGVSASASVLPMNTQN